MKLLRSSFFAMALLATNASLGAPAPVGTLEHGKRYWVSSPMGGALELGGVFAKYPNFGGGLGGAAVRGVRVGLEYIPFGEASFGKLGIGLGGSMLWSATVNTTRGSTALYAIPIDVSLSYRFDFVPQQILVPFVKAGPSLVFSKRRLPANQTPEPWKTRYGLDYGGGLQFCLSRLEPKSARQLDRGFGINDTYLVGEYVRSKPFNDKDATTNLAHDEVRFSLRFEM